ncbi:hypothetical protein BH11ACT2_BH11ACT2_15810 [soil metagenome]
MTPWTATLSDPQHALISFFLLVAAFALVAGVVRTFATRGEVGVRYRTATTARSAILVVAALTYVVLVINFERGYDLVGVLWVPNAHAVSAFAPRYMEWAVTVPLLVIELLAVTALTGVRLRHVRTVVVAATFLMVFAGYLGAFVVGADSSPAVSLLVWGAVSAVFWVAATAILIGSVRASVAMLTPESARILGNATVVLLSGWVVYPAVYVIQIFGDGGAWATVAQVALCSADVAVKLSFGGLTHRVAKLRTAEDVRAGEDVHPEAIWISSVKIADAGAAREVNLDAGHTIHRRRPQQADATAVASPILPEESADFD